MVYWGKKNKEYGICGMPSKGELQEQSEQTETELIQTDLRPHAATVA